MLNNSSLALLKVSDVDNSPLSPDNNAIKVRWLIIVSHNLFPSLPSSPHQYHHHSPPAVALHHPINVITLPTGIAAARFKVRPALVCLCKINQSPVLCCLVYYYLVPFVHQPHAASCMAS